MASIIRIKRSSVSGNPATLAAGELAYSALTDNGSNGGDRLYIGIGTETSGNAANHYVIGGKFFTDMLDHTKGTLTANSALVTDGNGVIDEIKAGNVAVSGNTVRTLDTNGNLVFNPDGTGKVSFYNAYTLPRADGSAGQALITNGNGTVSFATISTNIGLAGDSGSDTVSLLNDTLTFTGGEGIDTSVANNTVTISAELATDSNPGVASFNSTDFTVSNVGAVTVNTERIEDIVGAMVSSNAEYGIAVTYDDTNGKLDFDVADFTLTIAGDVDGSATVTNLTSTTVTVTLDAVANNTGSFGSALAVPVVTVDSKGRVTDVTTASISTSFTLAADTGTASTFNNGSTLSIYGGEGIDTSVDGGIITIAGEDASTSNKGIASFSSNSFDVTSGAVTIKTAGVSNTQLANSNVTVGSTTIALGGTSTTLAGITQLDVDNIRVDGNEISSTDSNGNISLNPNGTGTVDVNSSRITSVADPVNAQDAATKAYVDAVKTGLDVKDSVRAATTANITLSSPQTIDGVSLTVGDRVLVKNQTDESENGIYVVANSTWTRAVDFDNTPGAEVSGGAFTFVEEGTTNADSGWVLTTNGSITLGTTALSFTQFSGAGQIIAGEALSKTGNTLNVNVNSSTGGIEVSADALQLKSTVAGNGLTYTDGVIDVVGTADRISVSANAVDIASTYVGQSSITTLGTITTGTWNGTTVGVAYGGTGATTLTSNGILYGNGTGAVQATAAGTDGYFLYSNAGTPAWTNVIDGGTY